MVLNISCWKRHNIKEGRITLANMLWFGNLLGVSVVVLVIQSCPALCDPWTLAHQAPLSMGFSRQEYWSWLLFFSPGDLSNPDIEPRSPALQADSLPSEPLRKIPVNFVRSMVNYTSCDL